MSLIKPASEFEKPTGQIVRYAIIGPHPPIAATVVVAEAFRAAVLSALHATTGSRKSFLLSGHHANGKPDTEHRHAYYLPQSDNTGRIRELLVVSPQNRFSHEELTSLQTVLALQWNGPSTKTRLELLDSDDQSVIKLSSRWVSLTPYVPNRRFWGTHGKRHLTPENQISEEITGTTPECIIEEIKFTPWIYVRVRVAPDSKKKFPNAPIIYPSWVFCGIQMPATFVYTDCARPFFPLRSRSVCGGRWFVRREEGRRKGYVLQRRSLKCSDEISAASRICLSVPGLIT